MGLASTKTFLDRLARKEARKSLAARVLEGKDAHSVVALNPDDELVGVLLGYKLSASDKPRKFDSAPWMRRLQWALPSKISRANAAAEHLERTARGHVNLAMADLGASSIFEGEILGVRRKERGLGLGREMLRRSMEVARRQGCEVYYAGASGTYSQKVFRDLGFSVLREVAYADMRDGKGRELLSDVGEHSTAQFMYFRFEKQ